LDYFILKKEKREKKKKKCFKVLDTLKNIFPPDIFCKRQETGFNLTTFCWPLGMVIHEASFRSQTTPHPSEEQHLFFSMFGKANTPHNAS